MFVSVTGAENGPSRLAALLMMGRTLWAPFAPWKWSKEAESGGVSWELAAMLRWCDAIMEGELPKPPSEPRTSEVPSAERPRTSWDESKSELNPKRNVDANGFSEFLKPLVIFISETSRTCWSYLKGSVVILNFA